MAAEELEEWIDITGDGGLLKKILKKGHGHPVAKQCEVLVNYHGTLTETGAVFDSTRERGEPYTCSIGQGKVIKGWELGIPSMVDGESSILRCRADYAYGEAGGGEKIPPNATIDFEVEILDTFKKSNLNGIRNRRLYLKEETFSSLKSDAIVQFDFKVGTNLIDEIYGVKDVSLKLDDLDTFAEWPEFLHVALMEESPDSHFMLECQTSACPPVASWNVSDSEQYYITIYLKEGGVENPKELWQMNETEKIQSAVERKERGNGYFKRQLFEAAVKQYAFGIKALEKMEEGSVDSQNPEGASKLDLAMANEIRINLLSNLSMSFLKMGKHTDAIDAATQVIEQEPEHIKALTRRARGYIERGDFELGRADVAVVLSQDPNNDYCKKLDQIARKKIAVFKKKQKKLAQKMFSN